MFYNQENSLFHLGVGTPRVTTSYVGDTVAKKIYI